MVVFGGVAGVSGVFWMAVGSGAVRAWVPDMQNVERIKFVLAKLEKRMGMGAFRITDHWEGDLRAVGISARHDERQLAYIAVGGAGGDERYFLELETSPAIDCELPYGVCGRYEDLSFEELVGLIVRHFNSPTEIRLALNLV